jgi:hypothetical protein
VTFAFVAALILSVAIAVQVRTRKQPLGRSDVRRLRQFSERQQRDQNNRYE